MTAKSSSAMLRQTLGSPGPPAGQPGHNEPTHGRIVATRMANSGPFVRRPADRGPHGIDRASSLGYCSCACCH